MLIGQELLAYTAKNFEKTQNELARGAGYVRTTKKDTEQVLVKKFTDALLRAKGVNIRVGRAPGKTAQFTTKVHKSHIVLVGKVYVERFGLEPGDELEIKLDEDCIRLVPKPVAGPASASETEEEQEDDKAA